MVGRIDDFANRAPDKYWLHTAVSLSALVGSTIVKRLSSLGETECSATLEASQKFYVILFYLGLLTGNRQGSLRYEGTIESLTSRIEQSAATLPLGDDSVRQRLGNFVRRARQELSWYHG